MKETKVSLPVSSLNASKTKNTPLIDLSSVDESVGNRIILANGEINRVLG